MNTGERIKERRIEKRISLEALANKVGVVKSTIWRYEKGEITDIPAEHIFRIAEVLGTTPEYLLNATDNIGKKKMTDKQKQISSLVTRLSDDQCEIILPFIEVVLSKSINE